MKGVGPRLAASCDRAPLGIHRCWPVALVLMLAFFGCSLAAGPQGALKPAPPSLSLSIHLRTNVFPTIGGPNVLPPNEGDHCVGSQVIERRTEGESIGGHPRVQSVETRSPAVTHAILFPPRSLFNCTSLTAPPGVRRALIQVYRM